VACKIVFVGGGSFLWTERFAIDLFLKPALAGSSLVLVDIDPDARDLVADVCRLANAQAGAGWTVETAELDDALDGADYVVVQISTGGFAAMHLDYTIPEKYGVYHSVADTVGPGGISRTLRNVPVFVDLARRMEQRCPDAWMVHVTNPLAQLTRCVARSSDIKVVGLCHNFEGTMGVLARMLEVERDRLDADTYGVNHFTFLRNLTCDGAPVGDRLTLDAYFAFHAAQTGTVATGTTDDQVNAMTDGGIDDRLSYQLYDVLGDFPIGGAEHLAENFPYFLNDPDVIRKHRIRRKGVLPRRQEGKDEKRRRAEAIVAGHESLGELVGSREALADIVQALHTDIGCRAVVNLPNTGQIENLPRDAVVETWGEIGRDRITPLPAGSVPSATKGLLESIIAEEELAVEAALHGDRQALVQALFASPLMHRKDAVAELADELLAAHRDLLPQFQCDR
jgi:alpha-galactosidase